MSRCPYCRRELPGFETICQQCFEAGYERIAHPTPWWRRIRLTPNSLYAFLFVFGYVYLLGRIDRDHQPGLAGLAIVSFLLAAFVILIGSALTDPGKPKMKLPQTAYLLFVLFAFFFLRFWVRSTYHRVERPALFALVFAVIAAFASSFPKDTDEPRDGCCHHHRNHSR